MKAFEKLALATKLMTAANQLETIDEETLTNEVLDFVLTNYQAKLKDSVWPLKSLKYSTSIGYQYFANYQTLAKLTVALDKIHDAELRAPSDAEYLFIRALQKLCLPSNSALEVGRSIGDGILLKLHYTCSSEIHYMSWAMEFKNLDAIERGLTEHELKIDLSAIGDNLEWNYRRAQEEYAQIEKRFVKIGEMWKDWKFFVQQLKQKGIKSHEV